MVQARCVLPAKATLGECPLWDHRNQRLYWIDIEGFRLHRYDPATGKDDLCQLDQQIGSVALMERGGYVLAMRDGFARLPSFAVNELEWLHDPEADKPDNRFNDGHADPDGHFWAGTMDMAKKNPTGALYRLHRNGQVDQILDGFTIFNGLAFDTERARVYFADTPQRTVWVADWDRPNATLREPRVFLQMGDKRPDGASLDSEGGYWISLYGGAAVERYDPDGKLSERVEVPARNVTMAAFGGADLRTLYITTASEGLSDEEWQAYPDSGGLFTAEVGVKGLPEPAYAG